MLPGKIILLPAVIYMEDDARLAKQITRKYRLQSQHITISSADRPVVVFWREGIPLQDEDFDVVGSHDGIEWSWRLHEAGYRFRYQRQLVTHHIGHPSHPNAAMTLAGHRLLGEKVKKMGGEYGEAFACADHQLQVAQSAGLLGECAAPAT